MSAPIASGLLDDFYAECQDLLESIRGGIQALVAASAGGSGGARHLEQLLRGFHTVKGNSAIVGLRTAEMLSHAAEDLLRGLGQRNAAPARAELDLLSETAQRLHLVLTAHQRSLPPPSIQDLLERLAAVPGARPAARAAAPGAGGPVAGERWRCTFSPTPERDQRGINLASVRARLGAIGEIQTTTPRVKPDGSIEFAFEVVLREPVADPAAWEAEGIRIVRDEVVPAAEAPLPGNEPAEALRSTAGAQIVRVDLARLDHLMRITAELVIHRSRLDDRLSRISQSPEVKEITAALARSIRELRTTVSGIRLVPAAEMFNRVPLAIQDLTRGQAHPPRVVLEGQQTLVDKLVVERLREPLLHLVRNALSHGLEPAAEREVHGKEPNGTIVVSAAASGQFIEIAVADDGRGVDAARVAERAAELGAAAGGPPDADALLELLCRPGFSTRAEVDLVAGRGVGMAVVATTARQLGGTLKLTTERGRGTTFTLRLPLLVSIIDVVVVSVGDQVCAVPQPAVQQLVQVSRRDVRTINGTPIIPYAGGWLPFVRLRSWFGLPVGGEETLTVLAIRTDRGMAGLAVDRAFAQREAVLHPLADPLLQSPRFFAATELGDGRPVLVLDTAGLSQACAAPERRPPTPAPPGP